MCCSPANWLTPPISCSEVGRLSNNTFYQYIMIDDIEKKSGNIIETNFITVWSEKNLVENGENYRLIKNDYKIEVNNKNERFIKVTFEKQLK